MRKTQDKTILARNFTKQVLKDPLNWCPLLGYMPDIFNTHLQKTPFSINSVPIMVDHSLDKNTLTAFDVAFDCHDYVKEAREYWGIKQKHFNLVKYDPRPDIKTLPTITDKKGRPYKYNQLEQTCKVARCLFLFSNKIAWGDSPIKFLAPFSSTRLSWPKTDVLERPSECLLNDAQEFINDLNIVKDYKLHLDELYALYAIYESWHLIINLLNNTYSQKDEEIVLSCMEYIEKLLNTASEQRQKMLFEVDSTNFHKKKAEKRSLVHVARKSRTTLKEVFQTAVGNLHKENPNLNVKELYEHIFEMYRVSDDLILRFCGNDTRENVVKNFYEVDIGMDNYYLYCVPDPDGIEPDNPLKARIGLINGKDYETRTKKPRKFSNYCSEYFYVHNQNPKEGKAK